jgi:hypothetical protein
MSTAITTENQWFYRVIEAKDEALRSKDEALRSKDEALRRADRIAEEALRSKDEALHLKDEVLKRADAKIVELEARRLDELSKFQAIFENRTIVEIALKKLEAEKQCSGSNMTQRFESFAKLHIFLNNGGLKPDFEDALKELIMVTQSTVQINDVKRELKDLIHEISKPLHNLHYFSSSEDPGLYIGGKEPLCTAIGALVVVIQRLGVLKEFSFGLINASGKKLCSISQGAVNKIIL